MVFFGDTIIEEAYWGSRALQRAMFRYVINFKIKHTTQPIYWILISKGFKTYLLLANNYCTYYPNIENENQHLEKYVKAYCDQFFSEYYDEKNKLIDFGDNYQCLKADVAPITDEMRLKNNKISFFEKCNPTWVNGTELPCIGEITWTDLMIIAKRFVTKSKSKGAIKTTHPVQVEVVLENKRDDSKVA